MEDIEKLKNIGAREISKHTHIALNKIQNILECNYKDLKDSATTNGLLRILEREYQVDLKQWQEEYASFWENYDNKADEMGPLVNFKVTHENIAPNASKKGAMMGAIIVVLLGVGFFAYMNFYGNTIIADSNTASNPKEKNMELQDTPKVAEQNNETRSETPESKDLQAQAEPALAQNEETPVQEQNAKDQNLQNNTEEVTPKDEVVRSENIVIVPNGDVWVGIVYLDNGKRTSFITAESFEIDLKRPQTIITGHGMLEMHIKGEKSTLNSANKMFFAVNEKGEFSQITQGQYNARTKGLGW